ncbi:MAG TPA: ATP-binding protein [Anaerolineaceae bacterium]|nr:ATP-binding protein [Anaerolineaceae bacterium]
MTITLEQLKAWLDARESEHLEFKEAKQHFDFEELVKYCAALANEGGGHLILGISDKLPRRVVGSHAFDSLERTKAGLIERLHLRIEVEELPHSDGPVIVFDVPARPLGVPIQYKGAYWMRGGESLIPMTPDLLRRIFSETAPDFSAEPCPAASISDLDPMGMQRFRQTWALKSGNMTLHSLSDEQLLTDAELMVDGALLYAALILLGTRQALGRYLPQAEVIFEFRSSEASGPPAQREEYREGFFLFQDELWQKIDLRNERQHFQTGFFIVDVPTFNEITIREALLNAVSHRDYRLTRSVFVRQFARRLEITSPGGLLPGITVQNILWRQAPRNRRVAEIFARCGLVERSGQGMNRMFEECIKESKPHPDFTGTDDYQVALTFRGEVQDPQFLRFLEQIGEERLALFTTQDFLVLDYVHREQPVPDTFKACLPPLVDQGIIERVGRGKGTRYILSRQFYDFLGQKGVYTRKRGLDRETNKMLLLKHIRDNRKAGCQLSELNQVLPALSRAEIQSLLREMKAADEIHHIGRTKAARWYPGPGKNED